MQSLGFATKDFLTETFGVQVEASAWRPITEAENFPGFTRAWEACTDDNPAQIWMCSRRAAKTATAIRRTVKRSSERPGWRTLYIHRTRTLSKMQFFETGEKPGPDANPGVIELLRHHGIAEAKHDMTELWVRLHNGSLVQTVGCDNLRDVDKKLGFRWDDILIDECQDHADEILCRLVKKTILPTLIDKGGSLTLMGTPAEVEAGFWYEAYTGNLFKPHNWSMLDNPFIARQKIIDAMAMAGYTINFENPTTNDPLIQREIFGLHCVDPEGLMYCYRPGVAFNDIPAAGVPMRDAKTWRYAMGVDIGGVTEGQDYDGIVVLGWRMDDGTHSVYELESWKDKGDSEIFCKRVHDTYRGWQPMQAVCIDTAGAGAAKMIETLKMRLGVMENTPKPTSVDTSRRLVNDELRSLRMKVNPTGELAKALKSGRKGQHEHDVSAAFRYAQHCAINWMAKDPPKKEETYHEYLERNIAERHKRQRQGLRGMWNANRAVR